MQIQKTLHLTDIFFGDKVSIMKAIWKGSISFALVSIRVKLYPATLGKDISFRLLHKADNMPVEYKRRCPPDNKDLSPHELKMKTRIRNCRARNAGPPIWNPDIKQ